MDELEEKRPVGEPSTEQIESWKQQYGAKNIYRLESKPKDDDDDGIGPTEPALVVYCRKPNPGHLSRFTEAVTNKKAFKGLSDLVFDTRLWPDAEVVKNLAEDQPGLILTLGGQLQKLVGIDVNFTVTRL